MSARNIKGFTIFELMITVSVAAILASIAIPSFQDMMARNRVRAVAEEMSNSLAQARSIAIQKRHTVVLRPDAGGWAIQMDNSAGPVLFRQDFDSRVSVTAAVAAKEVSFRPSGLVQRTDVAPVALDNTYTVCDTGSRREVGRNVRITRVGRITTQTHASKSVCNP